MGDDEDNPRVVTLVYTVMRFEATQKTLYDKLKQSDLRSGRGLGMQVSDHAEVTRVGSAVKGADFTEGYYVYGVEEVVAGLRHGLGILVLRKTNTAVTITYSGGRITSHGHGRVLSDPEPTDIAKQVLDKLADPAVAAIVQT